jgi:hypothetical protein
VPDKRTEECIALAGANLRTTGRSQQEQDADLRRIRAPTDQATVRRCDDEMGIGAAMRRFAEDERKDNADMTKIMKAISPAEWEAMARYISGP